MNPNSLKIRQISSKLQLPFEVVERKGMGHPDTLADALAETLSKNYANFTRERCGAVLRHNFDKVGLLGGSAEVYFGRGALNSPIRVLLNGRASVKFAGESLDVEERLEEWTRNFLLAHFPQIRREIDIDIHFNLSTSSSPGAVRDEDGSENVRLHWFEPRSLEDLTELRRLHSNDTSLGVGYAPLSPLESTVLSIEEGLNSTEFKKDHPWIGSDIKLMATRVDDEMGLTICIPQLAEYVGSQEEYRENTTIALGEISRIIDELMPSYRSSISINTRDNFDSNELYLTAIGSSIESGDEGLVGRGNRPNGLISPTRPISMEGACGKNPVYHIGKIYSVAAQRIADLVFEETEQYCEVYLVSQTGRDLVDPWKVIIACEKPAQLNEGIISQIEAEIAGMPNITGLLLAGDVRLY